MIPHLALTEAALGLITHAMYDIPGATFGEGRRGRILTDAMGASTDPASLFAETALLRLVSVIEAYVDSVSSFKLNRSIDSRDVLVALLVEDFEVESSSTWQQRKDSYNRYHGFTIESRDGWGAIDAAIEVRNCLVHGLGVMTAKQRRSQKLAKTVSNIGASIGGGRVHLGSSSVLTLGQNCTRFVRHIDLTVGAR